MFCFPDPHAHLYFYTVNSKCGRMVVDTLEPMEGTRRAYRLVGGVLVERTVAEVLPTVKENQEGIKQVLQQLAASRVKKEKEAAEWKVRRSRPYLAEM